MALSSTWTTFASAAVAAPGTSVAPSLAVPDNCHTILVFNTALALTGLIGRAIPPAALVAGTNAIRIPPLTMFTLAVQTFFYRGPIDQAQLAGSGLAFDAIGGAITFDVQYLCTLGRVG